MNLQRIGFQHVDRPARLLDRRIRAEIGPDDSRRIDFSDHFERIGHLWKLQGGELGTDRHHGAGLLRHFRQTAIDFGQRLSAPCHRVDDQGVLQRQASAARSQRHIIDIHFRQAVVHQRQVGESSIRRPVSQDKRLPQMIQFTGFSGQSLLLPVFE